MSKSFSNLFRINLAEYYIVSADGLYRRILPRPKILFDTDALVIVSKLDQKVYDFAGRNTTEKQAAASNQLAINFAAKYGFTTDRINYPADTIPPDHFQFIEYFADEHYLQKGQVDTTKQYHCYFCEQLLVIKGDKCNSCGKEVPICFVCDFPILYGDLVGKCSLCGATAHLVHFYEWIKSLGMCPKCNQKLSSEGIIPITEENKDSFF